MSILLTLYFELLDFFSLSHCREYPSSVCLLGILTFEERPLSHTKGLQWWFLIWLHLNRIRKTHLFEYSDWSGYGHIVRAELMRVHLGFSYGCWGREGRSLLKIWHCKLRFSHLKNTCWVPTLCRELCVDSECHKPAAVLSHGCCNRERRGLTWEWS